VDYPKNSITKLVEKIQCPQGQGLVSFGMTPGTPEDRASYTFSCAPIPNLKGCWEATTDWTQVSEGRSEYLDRQQIWHYPNQVISGFQMQVHNLDENGGGYIRFVYNVCTQ